MKIFHILLALALATSLASAYDPSPLQDFCVATNNTNGQFVNGKFCKNPKQVTADDFFISGLNVPKAPKPPFGFAYSPVFVETLPGLNTLGLSSARVDYAPNGGQFPPHTHPRASEIILVIQGTFYVGFISSDPSHKLYSKILHEGDVFVFPIGLIHFQVNIGKTPGVAFAGFNSQNPGLVTVADAVFGSNPPLDSKSLAKAFQVNETLVKELQRKFSGISQ